jgi:hypothetical protein
LPEEKRVTMKLYLVLENEPRVKGDDEKNINESVVIPQSIQ